MQSNEMKGRNIKNCTKKAVANGQSKVKRDDPAT